MSWKNDLGRLRLNIIKGAQFKKIYIYVMSIFMLHTVKSKKYNEFGMKILHKFIKKKKTKTTTTTKLM